MFPLFSHEWNTFIYPRLFSSVIRCSRMDSAHYLVFLSDSMRMRIDCLFYAPHWSKSLLLAHNANNNLPDPVGLALGRYHRTIREHSLQSFTQVPLCHNFLLFLNITNQVNKLARSLRIGTHGMFMDIPRSTINTHIHIHCH